jgi:TRAP transporter TAXI family solute receptor
MKQTRRWVIALAILLLSGVWLLPAAARAQGSKAKTMTIGGAPAGGVYFVWGGGFAKLLNETLGIRGVVETTGGPVHNVQLLDSKQIDFGMVTAAPAFEGWYGMGWAKGKKYRNVRVIFPMYTTYFQMYALKKSGIRSMYDLNGKSVGVGPAGDTSATYWPLIFEVTGIKPARILNASSAHLNNQLKGGLLDASGQSLGLPWPVIAGIETTHEINVFGVPREAAGEFIIKYPYFAQGVIPANTYKSSKEAIPTLTLWNFMAVNKDAPEELVYKVVKAAFERTDILIAAHKSAREVNVESIAHSPVPLHPAAARFYREKGIKLPDALVSPK